MNWKDELKLLTEYPPWNPKSGLFGGLLLGFGLSIIVFMIVRMII